MKLACKQSLLAGLGALIIATGCSGTDKTASTTPENQTTNEASGSQGAAKPEPVADADGLRPHEPVACTDEQTVTLEKVRIDASNVAISVTGNCEVTIVDSDIKGESIAILLAGKGEVKIQNSTVTGGEAAFVIEGTGEVRAESTRFVGGRIEGDGTFYDGGDNSWE